MGKEYAEGRKRNPALRFRLRVRALVAVECLGSSGDPGPEDRAVLELGAAEGGTLLELRRLLEDSGDFRGVELSEDLLAARLPDAHDLVILHGDATRLPPDIPEDHFALVTALALLEHLDHPERCAREAIRVLKPGGVFVATCPNPFWDSVAGRLRLVRDEHHVQRMDRGSLVRLLESAGFEDVHFEPFMWAPIGFLPYLRIPTSPRLSRRVDRLVLRLGRWTWPSFVNQVVFGTKPDRAHG